MRYRSLGNIDLYQIHTPDPVTPIEETLTALLLEVAIGGLAASPAARR